MTEKQIIVITGATRGLGRAIAENFAKDEVHLVLTYRSQISECKVVSDFLNSKGCSHEWHQLDLSDDLSIIKFTELLKKKIEHIDVLINNAGMTLDGAYQLLSLDNVMKVIKTNLFGVIKLTLYLEDLLCSSIGSNQTASIVMMSSMAAVSGKEGQVPYATSKGGIIGFARFLGNSWGKRNVRVNTIAPGFIETDMVRELDSSVYQHVLDASAISRIGKPKEVADLAKFLASEESSYICSQTIKIDGGFLR